MNATMNMTVPATWQTRAINSMKNPRIHMLRLFEVASESSFMADSPVVGCSSPIDLLRKFAQRRCDLHPVVIRLLKPAQRIRQTRQIGCPVVADIWGGRGGPEE